jgi:hypothetical protein
MLETNGMSFLAILLFLLGYALALVLFDFFLAAYIEKDISIILPGISPERIELMIFAILYLLIPMLIYLTAFHFELYQAILAGGGSAVIFYIVTGAVDKLVKKKNTL